MCDPPVEQALLHDALPAACDALVGHGELLSALTAELEAPHVPQLLAHEDNAQRIADDCGSGD